MDFFIADTHFGHKNIIKLGERPFKSIREMEESIIEEWNKRVTKKDRVFILGDFSFYSKEKTKEIISRLNGYKILIKGNHDRNSFKDLFDEFHQFAILYNSIYILSHYPLYLDKDSPFINIFGHIHQREYSMAKNNNFFNVSVEQINYRPIRFSTILARLTNNKESRNKK